MGGITAVALATGISDRTIRTGIKELDDPEAAPSNRQRQPGAGRKTREVEQPGLADALEELVESGTRGDPMSPLRWTCKSTRTLADELQRQGFLVSCNTVGQLLRTRGFSLQANRKTVEGKQHEDRDAQFIHINRRVKACQRESVTIQPNLPYLRFDAGGRKWDDNGIRRRSDCWSPLTVAGRTVPGLGCGDGCCSSSPMRRG